MVMMRKSQEKPPLQKALTQEKFPIDTFFPNESLL